MNDFDAKQKIVNCPQCGATLPLHFSYAKLAQCSYCNSTIFLDDEGARLAGESSVLSDEVSLIVLNQLFSYRSNSYLPIGMVRYSYGRGFWEEWWLKDELGEEWWLSVDEGDMVLQKLIENEDDPSIFSSPYIGQAVGLEWIVSEIGSGVCEGFRGMLPKLVTVGQKHKYINLSGNSARLKSIEIDPLGMESYVGNWIDSFDIETLR